MYVALLNGIWHRMEDFLFDAKEFLDHRGLLNGSSTIMQFKSR